MPLKQLDINTSLKKQEFRSTLNGVDYYFYFRFNKRANRWVINIYKDDKTPLVLGLFLQKNSAIAKNIVKEGLDSELKIFAFSEE